jgi:DNA-binding MarR family transcriptional regulator
MTLSKKEYLQINQALFSLAHAYGSRMAKEGARNAVGLRLSDCSVLMVLGQCIPSNSRQLSRLMDVNPGTISIYVQRLVELGLVRKEQDLEDRRNWWLTLTEKGKEALKGVISGAVAYTRSFLGKLSHAEQRTLHRLLLKASHSLGFDWQ